MGVLTGFRRPKLNFFNRLRSAVSRDLLTHCSHFNKIHMACLARPFSFSFSFSLIGNLILHIRTLLLIDLRLGLSDIYYGSTQIKRDQLTALFLFNPLAQGITDHINGANNKSPRSTRISW